LTRKGEIQPFGMSEGQRKKRGELTRESAGVTLIKDEQVAFDERDIQKRGEIEVLKHFFKPRREGKRLGGGAT